MGWQAILCIQSCRTGRGIFGSVEGGGVTRFDGKDWRTFTARDGLAGNYVLTTFQDREGNLWFGTSASGVSRYNPSASSEQAWKTFTTKDGLAVNGVWSIFQGRDGALWFGSLTAPGGGVSRYDPSASLRTGGKSWTTFSTKDGMGGEFVSSMLQDHEGNLWFGTVGLTRYDGKNWRTFTPSQGTNAVYSIFQDREGYLWAGTDEGVRRYDGKTFTTFTTRDGLAADGVSSIFQDREGNLWFGTSNGLSRYDRAGRGSGGPSGKGTFTTFTIEDGLPSNNVSNIFQDREGNLWFGTDGGVSRYDGKMFTAFTTDDGLAGGWAQSIFQDRDGNLWFGTRSGGVSRYDGKTFQTLTRQDGLASNVVNSIIQDRDGVLWGCEEISD
ncbi:MAG: hypothetical protein EXS64_19890 [Candidatus Latescibacteria bacterium]|nr:hypothetical protein [Candidatus Latescibacterota bacterium]